MRIDKVSADLPISPSEGPSAPRSAPEAPAESGSSDQVVLSSAGSAAAIQAIVNSGGYEPDSLLTAGRIVDDALVRID